MSATQAAPLARYEREFLPATLELIETPASPAGRALGLMIIAIALSAVLWASLSRIDIVVSAPGRLIPQGLNKVVQPFAEGTVTGIFVSDGDHVTAGQTLISLDPTAAQADLANATAELGEQLLDRARLEGLRRALQNGQPPALAGPSAPFTPAEIAAATAQMQAQATAQAAKLADLDGQIAEKQFEAAEADAAIAKVQTDLPFLRQIAGMRSSLMQQQVGSRLDWLGAQEQLADATPSLALAQSQKEAALAQAAALGIERTETAAEYAYGLLDDLKATREKIDSLTAEVTKDRMQLALTSLTAPVDGTVQQLAVHTLGGVVSPAQPLLEIVPDRQKLLVEASVANQDIGFLQTGQTVQVKIAAFDFTRFGTVDGVVQSISRDVIDTAPDLPPKEDGYSGAAAPGALTGPPAAAGSPQEPGYIAHIVLNRDFIPTAQGDQPLKAGMAVTADIKTGRRSIMSYLLSPVMVAAQSSLHGN